MPTVEEAVAAIRARNVEAVERLLREDASLAQAKLPGGATLLLLAAYHGAGGIAQLLMDHGARPNVWEASALGRADLVREGLAASPGLLDAHSHDGWTPLHLAAHFGHEETAALLLARGAGVEARSRNGLANTPLQAAVAGRQARTAALLLAHGAEVDAAYLGMTPLWVAAHNGDEAIVRLLLEAGASQKHEDKEGRTPLAIAREKGHDAVARLLAERAPAA